MQKDNNRFIEIDYLRVIAIALMISYHLAYDLQTYYGFETNLHGPLWSMLEKISAGTFLLLTGLCFTLSWKSTPQYGKYLKRGATIFLYASVISIVTYMFDPPTYVRFGILHLIAVTTVLLPMFLPLGKLNAPIGLLMLWLGSLTKKAVVHTSLLIPLGFVPPDFGSVDYFPLLPWTGITLIGMACGYLYRTTTTEAQSLGSENKLTKIITAISKQSLLIYMLHQPILLLLLRIALGKNL